MEVGAQADGVGGTIDLSKFPADLFEEVIVPVPSEVFEVLDKLGQPNWRAEMRDQNNVNLTDRYEVALQFGVVVADGFIAVQAQDRQMIQNLGQEVRRLAQQLGLKDPVLKHAQGIMDSAERNDYDAVRLELDKTQRTVREEMEKMRDGELAQCVSIGGWLRGTEVVTAADFEVLFGGEIGAAEPAGPGGAFRERDRADEGQRPAWGEDEEGCEGVADDRQSDAAFGRRDDPSGCGGVDQLDLRRTGEAGCGGGELVSFFFLG